MTTVLPDGVRVGWRAGQIEVLMLELEQNGKPGRFLAREDVMLIGSASQCHCVIRGLPPLAALIARYGDSWVVHNLQSTQVQLNRVDVHARHELGDNDELKIGTVVLTVFGLNAPATPLPRMAQQCRISLKDSGNDLTTHDLTFDALIGSAHLCDIVLARSSTSSDRHALLVPARGHWFLYNLLSRVGRRNGVDWKHRTQLAAGDKIDMGGVVIQVLSVNQPPLPKSHPTSPPAKASKPQPAAPRQVPAARPEPPRPTAPPAASPAFTLPGSAVDSNPQLDTSTIVDRRPHPPGFGPPGHVDLEALKTAQELYNNLKSQHNLHEPPDRGPMQIVRSIRDAYRQSRAEADFLAGHRVHALRQMKKLLEESPWNRSALIGLARMCDAGGFDHLCLHVMLLLHRIDPMDAFANRAIARIYRQMGRSDSRFLRKSQNHWRAVMAARPDERIALENTIRKIDAEISILDCF